MTHKFINTYTYAIKLQGLSSYFKIMIIRVQFVKVCDEQPPSIIHKWAIYAVDESYTILRLFNAIKAGKITSSVFVCFYRRVSFMGGWVSTFPTVAEYVSLCILRS